MITYKQMRKTLGKDVDSVSKRGEIFTVRKAFLDNPDGDYYAERLCNIILRKYPTAIILDKGMQQRPYRMRARLSAQSHWFVKITFEKEK